MPKKTLAELFDDLAPAPAEQFFSVGYCCQLMEIKAGQLRVLMDDADVRFARCVDGVAYVDGDALVKIMSSCKKVRDDIAAAVESVGNN